ncbi:MAG: hypothetical protein IH621_07975 [Krumholzibacteria bacterium]|nr:hypothetical protein [Candidatus Krumholzibacteria bacterium]
MRWPALILLLPVVAAPARADRDGSPAFVPYAGVCAADVGGEHEPGLALGVRILRDRHRGCLQLTGGAEYLQKIGVGEVRAIDGGDGTVTSWGETEVTLHYAHGVDVQAAFGLGDLEEEPTGALGRGGAYPMFTLDDRKARSVRVAAGWVF